MRVLISGATGYLGAQLARAMLLRGDRVLALSRNPGQPRRLAGLDIELLSADPRGVAQALAGGPVDVLVLVAGSYGRAGESVSDLIEANCAGPLRLAGAAGCSVGRIVAIGSALPGEVSPYARSKRQFAEWFAELPAELLPGRDLVELQHFYGPGDDASKFLTRIVRTCLAGGSLDLTAGTQRRDFIWIDDVVSGILKVIDHPQGLFRRVELGSGEAPTVRSVVERIAGLAGGRTNLRFGAVPMRPAEPDCCVADTATLRDLGWQPAIVLDDGLAKLVASESSHL